MIGDESEGAQRDTPSGTLVVYSGRYTAGLCPWYPAGIPVVMPRRA